VGAVALFFSEVEVARVVGDDTYFMLGEYVWL